MDVVVREYVRPNLRISATKHVSCLRLEHGVLTCNTDEFKIVLSFLVGDESQVWITLLAVFADGERIILVVLPQEVFGIGVGVNVDLRECTNST